jgi:hypothetical protein
MTRPMRSAAARGVKERLRRLLASGSLAQAHKQRMLLGAYVLAADMPEPSVRRTPRRLQNRQDQEGHRPVNR